MLAKMKMNHVCHDLSKEGFDVSVKCIATCHLAQSAQADMWRSLLLSIMFSECQGFVLPRDSVGYLNNTWIFMDP